MYDTAHSYVWRGTFIRVTWHIHVCELIHSYVWHDTFICITWHIHMCYVAHAYVWHDTFLCTTRHIHMCELTDSYVYMTHSYVRHDIFICVNWRIHMYDMTHSYMWRGTCIRVTWHHSHTCGMTHMWHGSRAHTMFHRETENSTTWNQNKFSWFRRYAYIHGLGVTHTYMWHDSFISVTWPMCDTTHTLVQFSKEQLRINTYQIRTSRGWVEGEG